MSVSVLFTDSMGFYCILWLNRWDLLSNWKGLERVGGTVISENKGGPTG